jgi:hypothetical protein
VTDDELLRQFESLTLPFDQWTHRMHVRVAFCYLSRHPFEVALQKLRTGIKAYNAANDVPEGPEVGYDETTTVAFARLVHATMCAYGEVLPTPDSESFCDTHPQLLSSRLLRLFYSPAQRRHPRAKTTFVEPDLAMLPEMPGAGEPSAAAGSTP